MWAISASPLTVTTPIMNCTQGSNLNVPNAGLRFKQQSCNVSLTKQKSVAKCVEGESFGCNRTGHSMWTSNGCRGEFTCNGYDTTCDVDGQGTHQCFCGPPPPVTCTPWISDLQKEILFNDEVVAINQDVTPQGRPVGSFDPNGASVWARNMTDGSIAVAFYNAGDEAADMSIDFASLGWTADTEANVRDLWQHKDVGPTTGSFPASGDSDHVPGHSTHLFRLSKKA